MRPEGHGIDWIDNGGDRNVVETLSLQHGARVEDVLGCGPNRLSVRSIPTNGSTDIMGDPSDLDVLDKVQALRAEGKEELADAIEYSGLYMEDHSL